MENEELFLNQIGERVRRIRAIRGMSRKVLAEESGISERYLAQLESGKGNVSIILLKKIADVTGTRMEDVFVDLQASSSDFALIRALLAGASPEKINEVRQLLGVTINKTLQAKHIALIGLRGAGKSTLGKAYAQAKGIKFIELNKEIESDAGLPLQEIFSLYGQEAYRRYEQSTLMKLAKSEDAMVLATGGGIVADALTYDFLLNNFTCVWVKATAQEHMARVVAQGDLRPMANNKQAMQELMTIMESRAPLYAKAQLSLDTSKVSEEMALQRLTQLFT